MSSSLTILKWFAVFLVLFELNHEATFAWECFPIGNFKFDIYLGNMLPQGSPPLYTNCKSADTQFGKKTLEYGQGFHWNFCYIPFQTLYTCDLVWNNKKKSFKVFDAKHLGDYCDTSHTLFWNAKDDGIYFECNFRPTLNKVFDWDSA